MSAIAQILTIFIIGLCSLSSGFHFTWPTQAIPELIESNIITLEEGSYFTVFSPAALVLTGPIFAYLMDKVGRKKTVIVTALLQLISWVFVGVGGSVAMFYIGRVFSGIADAGYYTVGPVYMAEIASPKIRGSWGNLLAFCAYFGNLTSMVLVYNLRTRVSAYIFIAVPLLLLALMVVIPESPYFLLIQNNYEAATDALRWFRRRNNVEDELDQLKQDVKRQLSESGTVKDLFIIRSNRKALLIGAFVRSAQLFAGFAAVSIYAPFIFSDGGSNITAIESTLSFTGLVMVCNLGASALLDKIGRKPAMVISCGGCGIILLLEAVYFYLRFIAHFEMQEVFKWFPIVGMSLYVLFYSIGIGIMPTLVLGELFSSSVKGKCLCVMNMVFGIGVAISTKVFQVLMSYFGLYAAFGFFAMCCLVNTIGSYYIIPDTQGKTLEEIQQTLKS